MINSKAFKDIKDYNELVKKVSAATENHFNHLKLPYNNKNTFDIFIEAEKIKTDFVDNVEKTTFFVTEKKILDAGCGKGEVLISFASRGAKVYGIDTDENELEIAKFWSEKVGATDSIFIKKAGIEDTGFENDFFDLVTCSSVLEHVENIESAVKEMSRILKDGAFWCIAMPNPFFPREGHYKIFWIPFLPKKLGSLYLKARGFNPDFFEKDVYYLSIGRLTKILLKYGFKVVNLTEENIITKFRNPDLLQNAKKRKIVKILKKIKINNFVARLIIFFKFYSHAFIKAQKIGWMEENIYNKINPEEYDLSFKKSKRVAYLKEHWQPILEEMIKKYCDQKEVVDLGSGTGFYTEKIRKIAKKVVGIDSSIAMVNYAQAKYPDIQFVNADARDAFRMFSPVDVVFSVGLFEYMAKYVFVKCTYDILKKDGMAIIVTPNRQSHSRFMARLINKLSGIKYVPAEVTLKEAKLLFKEVGFDIVECRMDDGLFLLPGFLDKTIGTPLYYLCESLFRNFGRNPFSTNMLFIIKKT